MLKANPSEDNNEL